MKLRNVRVRQWRRVIRRARTNGWEAPTRSRYVLWTGYLEIGVVHGADGEFRLYPVHPGVGEFRLYPVHPGVGEFRLYPVHPGVAARVLLPERVDTPEGPITIRIEVSGGWTTITATMPDGTTHVSRTYSALYGPTG